MGILGGIGEALGGLFGGNEDEERRRKVLEDLAAEAGPSAFAKLTTDPALRGDQLATLNALRAISDAKGMDVQSRVAQREAQDEAAAQEQMQRGAILEQMRARGLGGSGLEFAAQLQNQQGAAQRNAKASAGYAAEANKRALQALAARGEMGGQIRKEDFGEAATRAKAQDAMSQFNAGQRVSKAGMLSGVYGDQAAIDRKKWAGLGRGIGSAGDAAVGAFL